MEGSEYVEYIFAVDPDEHTKEHHIRVYHKQMPIQIGEACVLEIHKTKVAP